MAIIPWEGYTPEVEEGVYMAPGSRIIGRVTLKKGVSIWFNAVLRGDVNSIYIAEFSNIQDNAIVHCSRTVPTEVGRYVTVGHGAVLHGCIIDDFCLIGMGSIILDKAEIGRGSIIGAGALVSKRTKIPPNSLVLGSPAKVVKELDPSDIEERQKQALNYLELAGKYMRQGK